jgi:predicted nucleic acid-binding protein
MSAFFDTTVLVAAVTNDTDRSQTARRLLNEIDDGYTSVVFPDASDIVAANRRQRDALLYPMDAIVLAAAESVDCPLVSFDSELLDHGAVEPSELLDE